MLILLAWLWDDLVCKGSASASCDYKGNVQLRGCLKHKKT